MWLMSRSLLNISPSVTPVSTPQFSDLQPVATPQLILSYLSVPGAAEVMILSSSHETSYRNSLITNQLSQLWLNLQTVY